MSPLSALGGPQDYFRVARHSESIGAVRLRRFCTSGRLQSAACNFTAHGRGATLRQAPGKCGSQAVNSVISGGHR